MTSREFCYWLQGFFEVGYEKRDHITAEQANIIRKHLIMVFIHEIDPSYPKEQQAQLNSAHSTETPPPLWMNNREEWEKQGRPRC